MGLAERIKEAIDGAKNPDGTPKTKAQIARECEVSGGAVSQWLSGEVKGLKADTIVYLEQATGYRANWIVHGKGPKRLDEPVVSWPFAKVAMERFISLDPGDQGYVERRLLQAIEEVEVDPPPNPDALQRAKPAPEKKVTSQRKGERRA
jgi:transcriptional regulator with XRE-family HTH domain